MVKLIPTSVASLNGPALVWAVAKCENKKISTYKSLSGKYWIYDTNKIVLNYHNDWVQGGPIIEKEGLSVYLLRNKTEWCCVQNDTDHFEYGPTPLVAAMRCYVASKLGDTVEIPVVLL